MRGFIAFTTKEFMEYIRSYKLLIIMLAFLALGFLNPITAKYLPRLAENFMPEGMNLEIAEPVIMDSWLQFFKNVPQMGLVIIVIIFSGSMSAEIGKGTLIPVLTKGLKRKAVWLSKLTAAIIVWSASYGVCFAATYLYSLLFWKEAAVPRLGSAVFLVWVFGLLLICLVLLGGTVSRSYAGGLLLAGAVFLAGMVMNMFQSISKFSPVKLISDNMALIEGSLKPGDFWPAAVVSVVLSIASVVLGLFLFDKKQL